MSRDIGRHREGLSEFRANQVRAELARRNPGVAYTVEEDARLKNGYAVVGRERTQGGLQMSREMPAELAQALRALRPPATVDSVRAAIRLSITDAELKERAQEANLWAQTETAQLRAQSALANMRMVGDAAAASLNGISSGVSNTMSTSVMM